MDQLIASMKSKSGVWFATLEQVANHVPTRASLLQFEHVFNDVARPQKVEAALNMQAQGLSDDFGQLEAIRRNPAGPNPYLYGPDRFARWMSIVIECGKARLAAMGGG